MNKKFINQGYKYSRFKKFFDIDTTFALYCFLIQAI
jgi:hypothetical protein